MKHQSHPPGLGELTQLPLQGGEAAGLDLDEQVVGSDDIDDVAVHLCLKLILRTCIPGFHRGVQRFLLQHTDVWLNHVVILQYPEDPPGWARTRFSDGGEPIGTKQTLGRVLLRWTDR